jgi:nicotinate-nucleotide pyrophosphorylase (carboxylating)
MERIEDIIRRALEEDIADGDHTSLSCIPADACGKAVLLVKEQGVLAGIEVARQVFAIVDPQMVFIEMLKDGQRVNPGDIAFEIQGKVHSILKSERLALNILQRMSGIATRTALYVSLVQGTKTRILDTRKTTPNLRILEKMAVRAGGGYNHRMGLYDMIMIKDNHVDFAGGISQAIQRTHQYLLANDLNLPVEIEVRNITELREALHHGKVNRIMLDNFSISDLREAVELIDGRYETEASGGITEESISQIAATGVDYISVGALTHHIKSLDFSLKAIE